ncbi:MAG: molybdopterin-dependent oxidoreductase, partial [Candidatus Rokubacteria bacterium]|nr:molybdopterin-dependent oxidoreductase [Candidatus Rokubacteria bacterium]
AACDAAARAARHVVRLRVTNNAVAPAPLEPRAAVGLWDPETGRYTLHAGLQAPHLARRILAEALAVGPDRVRVVVGDVGGGFGGKVTPYREDVLVLFAARRLGRPIRWCATRTEAFLGDHRGRDQDAEVTLALDADGRILALRAEVLLNVGAFPSHFGLPIATGTGHRIVNGVYHVPCVHVRLRAVLTHTPPTGPYRGAGRPEVIHRLERVLDLAALELGLDPVELRRRNLIPAGAIPYTNPAGQRYDSGDFPLILARALAAADWDGFPARRAAARARGRLRGRGVACHIDSTSGLTPTECARAVLTADGAIEVFSGTQEIGQGIQATYARLVAARLGVEPDRVHVVQGDTDRVVDGGGTYGSRSLHVGGSAVVAAAEAVLERVKTMAAARLEAAPSDVEVRGGRCRVVGTEVAVTLEELAAGSPDGRIDCAATATSPFCYPNGAYVCEVEIDPETGVIDVVRFVAVDDAGIVVNPPIVEGQVHGGVAQGIAQALWEHARYDTASGQLLAASFMEYAVPRASDLPAPTVLCDQKIPATTNALGAKGAGESGAVGAPPAVIAAVVDALREFGVTHLDMPIAPAAVWRILARKQLVNPRAAR